MRKGRYGPAGVAIAYQAVKPVPGTVTSSRTGIHLERLFYGTPNPASIRGSAT